TKIKPETIAAMVLTGIQGMPLNKVPPLELVVPAPRGAVCPPADGVPDVFVRWSRPVGPWSTLAGGRVGVWSCAPIAHQAFGTSREQSSR
ncbi:hypothetical protein AB0R12_28540, partial [Streptomyces niveus]